MEFNINVHNSTLEATGVQEKQGDAIIKGFFGVLGFVDTPQALFPLETFKEKENLHKDQTECLSPNPLPVVADIFPSVTKKVEQGRTFPNAASASKRVDLIGKSVEPIGTLGEIATIKEQKKPDVQVSLVGADTYRAVEKPQAVETENKDHWITGIQIGTAGEKRYRTYYWCDCGNKGKRYIEVGTDQIHCHNCNKKIWVDPATLETDPDTNLPVRDAFGNFFIAREMVGVE